jgi:MAF protein
MIQFLLASQSPRRRELFDLLGYPFTSMAADADEAAITTPDPAENVVDTAVLKAAVIAAQLPHPEYRQIILAADTTVALDDAMLNKPIDAADAQRMLMAMRNRSHEVLTGYVLWDMLSGEKLTGVSTAVVTMRPYTDQEIDHYIASGDPMDKAGAYAIQHPEFQPVARLEGCYLNVMGLPVCDLILALEQFGVPIQADLTAVHQAHQNYLCPTFNQLTLEI